MATSLATGLNEAVAGHLAFGRDIVFPMGPYAAVLTRVFHPGTDTLALAASLWFALSFAVVASECMRRAHWSLQLTFVAAVAGFGAPGLAGGDALFLVYPLLAGLLVVLAADEDGDYGAVAAFWLTLLAVLPFALLILIKSVYLPIVGIASVALLILLVVERQWLSALAVLFGPALALVLLWLAAGQPIATLPDHFRALAAFSEGYGEATGFAGGIVDVVAVLAAAFVLFVSLAANGTPRGTGRAALSVILLVTAFLAFRATFVEHGAGVAAIGAFLLLAGFAVKFAAGSGRATSALAAAVLAAAVIDAGHLATSTRSFAETVVRPYADAYTGLRARFGEVGQLTNDYRAALAAISADAPLPMLDGAADSYPGDPARLIAAGNRWDPRPTIVSDIAYTPMLARANAAHLAGSGRPDSLVVDFSPSAETAAALADGGSWAAMLGGYEPRVLDGSRLVLVRRDKVAAEVPVDRTTHAFDEAVSLPATDGPLFVRITLRPTLLGRLAAFFVGLDRLEIAIDLGDGEPKLFPLVSGKAAAGFVLSPFIDNAGDFARLYLGAGAWKGGKARAFTIRAGGGARFWQSDYDVELSTLEVPRSDRATELVGVALPEALAPDDAIDVATSCDVALDGINGITPVPAAIDVRDRLVLSGWLAMSAKGGTLPEGVRLILTGADGKALLVRARTTERPDVVARYGKPGLARSGFRVEADVSGLSGSYRLGIGYVNGIVTRACPGVGVEARIGG
jgi:hypothetical protein